MYFLYSVEAKPIQNLPVRVFQRYCAHMSRFFQESPGLLAVDLFTKEFIGWETLDKVQSSTGLSSLNKANILLLAVGTKIAIDKSDKMLRKLCKILAKHQHLKKLSSQIKKTFRKMFNNRVS